MHLKVETLDDALGDALRRLLRKGNRIVASKGPAREFTSVLVEIRNPRARLSRTEDRGVLISFLGETLWYISGSDRLEYIEYYIPKYRKFIKASRGAVRAPGAYGPRLFGGQPSQIEKLITSLKLKNGKSDTRQAVAQIFDKKDLRNGNNDVPCTTTLQFLPRAGKLNVVVTMRSNDIYRGFPADVFAFTFIQEFVARTLGLELGTYSHFAGSLHLYDDDREKASRYLREGFQSPTAMPPMPAGDPSRSLQWLLETEEAIRRELPEPGGTGIDPYWLDLARVLKVKVLHRQRDMRGLVQIKNEMSSSVYDAFVRGRELSLEKRLDEEQPPLPLEIRSEPQR